MQVSNDVNNSLTTQFKIPFSVIEDHIQCSICLSAIRVAVLTPCGHRYCSRCITEWIGRNHTCPCCNSSLEAGQVYFDVQFDSFVDTILAERDKAEEEYYNKVFGSCHEHPTDKHKESAFENILKKHMKSSLISHQKYFDNLHDQYRRKIQLLEHGITEGVVLESQHYDNASSVEEIKDKLTQNLCESERLAADAFDKYLKDNVPSLEVVPVTVSIYIADKDVRLENVIIMPKDSLSVVKTQIEEAMRQRSNDIISWTDDGGTKLLFGPLMKSIKYNIEESVKSSAYGDTIQPLHWDSQLLFQHNMKPASEIVLYKVFQSQSDLPKVCFRSEYIPNNQQTCDYFTCDTCDHVNWICKSCIQCCHEGHTISPFALNHTPTWACCYCPKKGLCKIKTPSIPLTSRQHHPTH